MKISHLLILLLCLSSCKAKHQDKEASKKEHVQAIVKSCPTDGHCNVEIFRQKSFNVKFDSYGNSYEEILAGKNTLAKFTYEKSQEPDVVDGSYREVVYLELPENLSEMVLSNESLNAVKATFGRFCYCKGQTGYYPIEQGELKINLAEKNVFVVDFDFKITEVPQILTRIQFEIHQ
ncbi:MAG TPA: hypothetical protein VKZ97_07025 [Flavobacteriaceae bacterium]|nr:hypothetical protein [Flavobacteriaceae bacterium]